MVPAPTPRTVFCSQLKGTLSPGTWVQYVLPHHIPPRIYVGIFENYDEVENLLTIRRANLLSTSAFVERASHLTTEADMSVMQYNNPLEIFLTDSYHEVEADSVVEYAFVLDTDYLQDNPEVCIAGITNAYFLRFESFRGVSPSGRRQNTLRRLDDPNIDDPVVPFVSFEEWDRLADDIPRMNYHFVLTVQEHLRAIFRSQGKQQATLVAKTRKIAVSEIDWDYCRRRLTNEDNTIDMVIKRPKRTVPCQHHGLCYSKIRLTKEPSYSVLIVTQSQLSAFERTFGTTVTIGVRGPMPSVKAPNRKRPVVMDTLNVIDPPTEEPEDNDELKKTQRILLTYYRRQLTIFVCYSRILFQKDANLDEFIRLVEKHGVIVSGDDGDEVDNLLDQEQPAEGQLTIVDTVDRYATFYLNGRLMEVDSVDGYTVLATYIGVDRNETGAGVERMSEVVARNEEEYNSIRSKIRHYFTRISN